MIIRFDSGYIKAYRKRIRGNTNLVVRTTERVKLFTINSRDPILKDHKLSGSKKNYRSFWVTGDIRIVYFPISEKEVLFIDIGSHNQVY